jgi:hypothetical protein
MKTWTIADGNGYSEDLDAGTTKKDAELILASLPAGWTLTSRGNDEPKPTQTRRKSAYGRDKNRARHGYWPTTSAIPRESALVRHLPAPVRVRMDDAPVFTYELNAAERPV